MILLFFFLLKRIVRNAKDTAHTKAERNILECVKVKNSILNSQLKLIFFSVHLSLILSTHFKQVVNYI
jgi:hypothetical protein